MLRWVRADVLRLGLCRSEAEFTQAIALDDSDAIVHQWYAYLLTAMERPLPEAEREITTAAALDPLSAPHLHGPRLHSSLLREGRCRAEVRRAWRLI